LLAQANQHHFHQAAFKVADKIGVRLDAAAGPARGRLEACRSKWTGNPSGVWQTTTVSIDERIVQPQYCSLIP